MKKILLLSAIGLAALTGCGSLDINEDPNNPSGGNVGVSLIMPAAQNYVAVVTGDGMYNTAGFFVQYFEQSPVASQYNKYTWYQLTADDDVSDRWYSCIYAGALEDIEQIKTKTSNTADLFAATALRAYALQLMVDATGETPYTEANKGAAIQKPKYDNGQDVYTGVLKELDDAEAALKAEDKMQAKDLIANGDLSRWKGFVNALRVRMYLRMIQGGVDVATYTQKLKDVVNQGQFFSGNFEYQPGFRDETAKSNPWFEANHRSLTANHVAAKPIIDYLKITNDPRIAYSFVPATTGDNAGQYAGLLPGTHQEKNYTYSDAGVVSTLKYYPTKAVEFFTQAELQFLLSEVYLKYFSDEAKAKAAYEAGVRADFDTRGVSGADAFLAGNRTSWDAQSGNDAKLKLVYMQKWVALLYMDHMEAWSEQRRTNVPAWNLTGKEVEADATRYVAGDLIYPYRDDLGTKAVPLRVFYSTASKNLNENVPEQPALTTPVFWDK